ncbi:HD-GYP domain-containing protein [Herbaspirillum rhizosphaerae]|uniref:HD-GYP domain-containing protein n=1 Tax=Herbaspirillum rhizosphaerae TaxID=346179 RepID=UPI00067ABFA5|nr:HD-GYP domain-containing protein [Herbaspirillum rhizosphaerae]
MSHLKKINVADLRLGMYLHGFDEAWIKNPFWKSKFLLRDYADLQAAWTSGIETCWIDLSKGRDVSKKAQEEAFELPETEAEPEATSFDEELERAAILCKSARAATISMFNEVRLGNAINVDSCLPLVADIAASVLRNPGALISLARLKTSDDYTYMHSVAVCALMVSLGRTLGFDEEACREAGIAGLLHDIGKALTPAEILNKPSQLSDEEFTIIKRHTVLGHAFLTGDRSIPAAAGEVCLHHHERIDGGGYPEGVSGGKLSLLARMGAVCDVYDAITSNRPYKDGWDPAESLARMASWKGHFDQTVLSAFVKSLGIYPTGALVKLSSGRLAVVVEQTKASLTKPIVRVFFREEPPGPIDVELVDLSDPAVKDSIVGRESRERWNLPSLESLWAGQLAARDHLDLDVGKEKSK